MLDFRIPKDPHVMKAMARYLEGEAGCSETDEPFCKHCGMYEDQSDVADRSHIEATIPSGEGGTAITTTEDFATFCQPSAEVLAAGFMSGPGAEEQRSEAELAFGKTAEVLDAATEVYSAPVVTNTVAPSPGVELDGDGLPWDGRIHAASKAKLSKAPHGWKKKRNVATELVAEVEAELRQALAASPDSPVVPGPNGGVMVPLEQFESGTIPESTTAHILAPATTNPEGVRMITVIQCGEQVEVPITSVIFPEFMALVTAAGIPTATALAAVNLAGLQSILLLATRQDLIPNVIETLFPVGA